MKDFIKKLGNALYILLAVVFCLLVFSPAVYWFMNPELTKMQVFIDMWWVFLITMLCGVGLIRFGNYR
tara:strand:+ start:409 stop:612 length:204 start_codon:yes stop_codon:yes gene_type:complete